MGTRRLEQILRRIRRETGNEDYGADSGISQTQLAEYVNEGLHFLEEGLNQATSKYFSKTDFIDLVYDQEKYSLPSDMLQGAGVQLVEAKINNTDYQKIKKNLIHNRNGWTQNRSNVVNSYIIQGREILVNPKPSTNLSDGLRVTYTKALTRLDVRRGTINSATDNGTAITQLIVDTTTLLDPNEFDEHDYICLVDRNGNILVKDIAIEGIDSNTGEIDLVGGSHTPTTGETLDPTGAFVVFGKNTSTHQLDLDANTERFLIAYGVYKVLKQDSSTELPVQLSELQSMRDSILLSYAQPDDDILLVPESC